MRSIDTLIFARWILPIIPRKTLLEDHAIAFHQGRIIDILPFDDAKKRYSAQNVHHRHHHVVLPGLINTHAHTPMNLFRGLADDLHLMDWLQHHIWPAEQAILCSESVYVGSSLAIAEMLRGGITCFNDHYFFPSETAQAAIDAGMRACIGLWVGSVPTGWGKNAEEYMKKARFVLTEREPHSLITFAMAPHSPYVNDNHSLQLVKNFSDEFNLKIHIHLHETETEIQMSIEQYNERPLTRFHRLELLNDKLIAVHMVHLTDEEIELCKETGIHISHNPESNLKLASGFAPVLKLLRAGVNVSLGTDGAASNNDLDMFGELRTASFIAKALNKDPTALDATTTLEMATINGAKALGMNHEIGSLEIGKAADVITVNLEHYFTQPIYNPISHLAYAVNRLQVDDVWVAGKQLLNQGEYTFIDINEIVEKAKHWATDAAKFNSLTKTV